MRINLQLIDAESDEHVWAETYDRRLTVDNLLSIQSEVARRVAETLRAALTEEEAERVERRPTDNLKAYACCVACGSGTEPERLVLTHDTPIRSGQPFHIFYDKPAR